MSNFQGYECVRNYVRDHRDLSLNDFLTQHKENIPQYSASIVANDSRELANVWKRRINQEINNSNRSNKLLTLPKVLPHDWELVYKLSLEYKNTTNAIQVNTLRAMESAATLCSGNIASLFEHNNMGAVIDNNVSDSFLSDAVIQFAHDRFSGNKNVIFRRQYADLLEQRAASSIKFKLYLYAVNQLQRLETLKNHEERIIKLCLSRIVNLLNKDFSAIFRGILGESAMLQISGLSKKHLPLSNYLDESSRNILDRLRTLPDEISMLSMINTEKISYLANRDINSQPYQVMVILEYLINSFHIWDKTQLNASSELTCYRRFIPIVEQILADTDIMVVDGESKSISSSRHMQLNTELFDRKSAACSGYEFGRKIDFILKDNGENELNTCEFKKKNVSKSVIFDQQVKNLRDNAAVFIDSKKATNNSNISVMGIDYIGNTGYLYQVDAYEDVMIASPISILHTPCDLASLNNFDETLNSLYYLKSKLMELSSGIKAAKAKASRKFDLVDVFDIDGDEAASEEGRESNVFYAPKSKKLRTNEEEE